MTNVLHKSIALCNLGVARPWTSSYWTAKSSFFFLTSDQHEGENLGPKLHPGGGNLGPKLHPGGGFFGP